MHDEQAFTNAQPLKFCDKCKNSTDPKGGVGIREKWYCAKCWIKFTNLRQN